jgi:hypothetical protein
MSEQENVLSYAVVVYRKDNEHIIVQKASDFTEAKKLWRELQEKWVTAHKEVTPFILDGADILCDITCFEPGLIKEIKLEAVSGNSTQGMEDNPYMKRMMQQGLAKSLQNPGRTGMDLLDNGYKF